MSDWRTRLWRRKTISEHSGELRRTLGPWHLILLGIGATIGTGIFVLTGTAAAGSEARAGAGPAIVLSFAITAIACSLAALCYAEYASMVPVSGSAYTYAYATFGELVAWIIGWDLLLEYAVGNVAVAIGWSEYLRGLLGEHMPLPAWLLIDPMTARAALANPGEYPPEIVQLAQNAVAASAGLIAPLSINLPAVLIVGVVTLVLWLGMRESATVNAGLVFLKLAMIAVFCWFGLSHVDIETHWTPFAPNGWQGVITASAVIFFAYIGFDAVSTAAEECRNPQRDLPIGMLGSLAVCAVLYVIVAAILTAMVPLEVLNTGEPVTAALRHVGSERIAAVIAVGVLITMTTVLLVLQYGQTRILYAMSRDRLLPAAFATVSRRGVPGTSILICGAVVAVAAGLVDISAAADLTSIGTLFAFVLISSGVLWLRRAEPERPRPFRVRLVWLVCPLCAVMCFGLMLALPAATWVRFIGWMLVGLIVYGIHLVRTQPSNA